VVRSRNYGSWLKSNDVNSFHFESTESHRSTHTLFLPAFSILLGFFLLPTNSFSLSRKIFQTFWILCLPTLSLYRGNSLLCRSMTSMLLLTNSSKKSRRDEIPRHLCIRKLTSTDNRHYVSFTSSLVSAI
jgi:hypothetical protein